MVSLSSPYVHDARSHEPKIPLPIYNKDPLPSNKVQKSCVQRFVHPCNDAAARSLSLRYLSKQLPFNKRSPVIFVQAYILPDALLKKKLHVCLQIRNRNVII